MKVLVFSDSHGDTNNILHIIEENKDVNAIIHLGDVIKDAEFIENCYPSINTYYVAGNNDWFSSEPNEKVLNIARKKLFIAHGHNYGVKNGCNTICQKGKELGADLVLFGHTHRAYEEYISGVLVLNPGSVALPVSGAKPSYAIVEILEGEIKTKICYL